MDCKGEDEQPVSGGSGVARFLTPGASNKNGRPQEKLRTLKESQNFLFNLLLCFGVICKFVEGRKNQNFPL
jgi:hypothetical protein